MKRIGVIGIIVSGNKESVQVMQSYLTEYSDIIVGRMGVPMPEKHISAISLIVKGENERVSALTGKLGRLTDITVKSALINIEVEEI
ncbi:MAG: TM1266 family iron-only hydrogenase system putative regulator [Eubacteriales bacterium]|nr:TM1266 family iron-only hydrogenase system putative regulator [Eubacteriales bacterium]